MNMKLALPAALLSALLVGCGSSGGGDDITTPAPAPAPTPTPPPPPPPPAASIDSVPAAQKAAVTLAKTRGLSNLILKGDAGFDGLGKGTGHVVAVNGLGGFTGANTKIEVDGLQYSYAGAGSSIDLSALPNGLVKQDLKITYDLNSGLSVPPIANTGAVATGAIWSYSRPYSVVLGVTIDSDTGGLVNHAQGFGYGKFTGTSVDGLPTSNAAVMALAGSATYTGVAYDNLETGTLTYTVNFDSNNGFGSITGFTRTGHIDLLQGSIAVLPAAAVEFPGATTGVDGVGLARLGDGSLASYRLGFFGPSAGEIAGYVYHAVNPLVLNKNVNFSGAR